MATRGEIRDAFTSELKDVSGTYSVTDSDGNEIDTVTLESDDIGLRNPEQVEQLPQVVYHDDYRRVYYNHVGAGPDYVDRAPDGSVNEEVWREYIEAQFIIDVRSSNEVDKEPIYEYLREQFARYQFDAWDEKSLHEDIIDISVHDSSSVDSGDEEDVIRGDQIEVRITFFREYSLSTENITKINEDYDADDDGTSDYQYVTT